MKEILWKIKTSYMLFYIRHFISFKKCYTGKEGLLSWREHRQIRKHYNSFERPEREVLTEKRIFSNG